MSDLMMKAPVVRILTAVEMRSGKENKPMYVQRASVEVDQFRVEQELYVDGPNMGYPVGAVYDWNLTADLSVGQYTRIELARRKTLIARAQPGK